MCMGGGAMKKSMLCTVYFLSELVFWGKGWVFFGGVFLFGFLESLFCFVLYLSRHNLLLLCIESKHFRKRLLCLSYILVFRLRHLSNAGSWSTPWSFLILKCLNVGMWGSQGPHCLLAALTAPAHAVNKFSSQQRNVPSQSWGNNQLLSLSYFWE